MGHNLERVRESIALAKQSLGSIGVPPPRLRRFTREEFQRLIAMGLFREDERLELINGELREMNPPNPPHATIAGLVAEAIRRRLPQTSGLVVLEEKPLVISKADCLPLPDVAVVRRSELSLSAHPKAPLLVVEVADTSLLDDLGVKSFMYASGKVPELWVVDINAHRVVVHRSPRHGAYFDVTEERHHVVLRVTRRTMRIPLKEILEP